jgi:hypothetical protein
LVLKRKFLEKPKGAETTTTNSGETDTMKEYGKKTVAEGSRK